MATKKEVVGEVGPKNLWDQELVKPFTMTQFVKDTADTEKMNVFGESSTGKTRFYLSVLPYLKKIGIPKEHILMCIIYPDRSTGLTKIFNIIPKEFLESVLVFPISNYEELVSATALAEKKLKEHYQKTGVYGWLVSELLEESWRMSMDYYSRMAFGETLADLMAAKRQEIQELMKAKDREGKDTAFQALEGFKDWTVIKFYHNFNWIDKIKRMPFNVVFTAEIKEEVNKDSIFFSIGCRPGGEKDNIHRVDTILYLKREGDNFKVRPFKLTGYNKMYGELDITNKNGYEVHRDALKRLEQLGYKTSKIEDLETQAGIIPPKLEIEEKTVTVISKEGETKISKTELTEQPKKEEKKEEQKDQWSF